MLSGSRYDKGGNSANCSPAAGLIRAETGEALVGGIVNLLTSSLRKPTVSDWEDKRRYLEVVDFFGGHWGRTQQLVLDQFAVDWGSFSCGG